MLKITRAEISITHKEKRVAVQEQHNQTTSSDKYQEQTKTRNESSWITCTKDKVQPIRLIPAMMAGGQTSISLLALNERKL